ncbi:MAG: hypothetical protein D5S00_07430 [Tindallia sp. MSAO_Bac2]|nr:MAG: hypothetical protein D5S00_07430 [Tindallia sp. MSAO_Bac2]
MSQTRKIKRNKAKKNVQPEKGKKVMKIMITAAVVLIVLVIFLGVQSLRHQAEAPAGNIEEIEVDPGELEDISLMDEREESQNIAELAAEAESGTIFAFFLGAA